ncbi:MAG: alpha/beta hydrolase [Alphaproteobacteria bacterium]|nr:alpha/beta hydrolase [Alphaproteobacteria bacterium]
MKYLLYLPLIYVCLVGVLYIFQRSLIYFPPHRIPDVSFYAADGVFEVTADTIDGLTLNGWMRHPEDIKETIIFFHGNASSVDSAIYKIAPYAAQGYGFLLAGYRGYSGNRGKPSEQGLYNDARAWIKRLKNFGISEDKIILYGESLGTGIAVQMATEFPNVRAVILESPYTNLPDVAAKSYPFVPVRLLMKDKFDSLSKIGNMDAPLLILQGMDDKTIPPALGKNLFASAKEPKEIIQLEGYGHNDMPPDILAVRAMQFLDNL